MPHAARTPDPLSMFPKQRPPLPAAFSALYERQYLNNRQGASKAASLSQRMEAWMHRQVAADVVASGQPVSTLEIGAGTLNHLPHEPAGDQYDVVEPFTALYRDSPWRPRVRSFHADIRDLPPDRRYQRIVSIATFEHLCDLPWVAAEAARRLQPGGLLRVAIPSEGTPLWTLGWRLTTGLEFRLRHGLDYGILMRHEHVNSADEIEAVLRHFFRDVKLRCFGLSRRWSLYRYLECSQPDLDRCERWTASNRFIETSAR